MSDLVLRAAVAGRDSAGVLVDPVSGQAVEMSEARRVGLAVGALKADAKPEGLSDAVPVAPARGPVEAYRPSESVMTGSGPRVRREPMPAGSAARVVSPLERMEAATRRRSSGPVFTVAQHITAGAYAQLFERVNGGRVKCADWDGTPRSGAGSLMDAIVGDIQRLRRMDRVIGRAPVLVSRGARVVPGRKVVRADMLVHWALIRADPLSMLLARRGWVVQSRYLERLRSGLAAALDRMQGM